MTQETEDSTKIPFRQLAKETFVYTLFYVAFPIGITYAIYYAWAAQGWFSP